MSEIGKVTQVRVLDRLGPSTVTRSFTVTTLNRQPREGLGISIGSVPDYPTRRQAGRSSGYWISPGGHDTDGLGVTPR